MHDYSFQAMGTDCRILLDGVGEDRAATAAEAAIDEVERLEQKYSRHRPDSTLSRINRACGAGEVVDLDVETAFLLDYAGRARNLSDGAFDITSGILRHVWRDGADPASVEADLARLLPWVGFDKLRRSGRTLRFAARGMELDLGGLVKEYAADRAAERCRRVGAPFGLVDLGGDVAVVGARADGRPWEIEPKTPPGGAASLGTFRLEAGGVATSGDYERWTMVDGKRCSHILDARTGRPASGLSSVTVIADTVLLAGTLATIAILRGVAGVEWLEARGVAHLAMGGEGRILGDRITRSR